MQIKDGAVLMGLDRAMSQALVVAEAVWGNAGQELVVTSGLDGTHSAGSLHYCGRAVDLRTRYFPVKVAKEIANTLRAGLPDDYDVVWHLSHVHVEFDPKGE